MTSEFSYIYLYVQGKNGEKRNEVPILSLHVYIYIVKNGEKRNEVPFFPCTGTGRDEEKVFDVGYTNYKVLWKVNGK